MSHWDAPVEIKGTGRIETSSVKRKTSASAAGGGFSVSDAPAEGQAQIVAGLWQVSHPAVTDLLTALGDHHPEPMVARAARKAAFKARSPLATPGLRTP